MCGRYTLTIDIKTVAEKFGVPASLDTSPRYNIAPTQEVVSVMRNGASHLARLRWGLIDSRAKDESIGYPLFFVSASATTEKPSFKGLLRSKRCLIVADGFYEW